MDEVSQVTLDSLNERLFRLEREMTELRQFLYVQILYREQPADGPNTLSGQVDISRSGVSAAAAYWEVTCFGRFRHRCADRDLLPCRSRRGQSILKYLLSRPRHAASTEQLIECFWPHMDSVVGAHNLQVAVHTLRRSLQGCGPDGSNETVLFCDDHYLLNPALSIMQDVDAFRDAYEQGQCATKAGKPIEAIQAFERARTYYRGDYLTDPYEDWASSFRLALQDMQLTLLNQLGTFYGQSEKWELAASCYRQILAVDCYREDVSRQLMRCYAACGRTADVKQTYMACQEWLRRDLRLAPASQTRRLYQDLIRQLTSTDVD
jgi:DNA-binding SARP family transcriptional activator